MAHIDIVIRVDGDFDDAVMLGEAAKRAVLEHATDQNIFCAVEREMKAVKPSTMARLLKQRKFL